LLKNINKLYTKSISLKLNFKEKVIKFKIFYNYTDNKYKIIDKENNSMRCKFENLNKLQTQDD